ncbi:calcium-binding protein [Pararhizobium sp. YC-54]|uniref:calcium-binding protein n=1 Tax=Pararhizobium sp. YC-54 TaxID=2986920 RepID=UPI0021F7A159|nr:calcium-binding protein [Pararhizobium sp. YC-54]MCW0000364.1 calcium-binding protein [Pararhizobium sp. YC-54]
MARIIIDGTNSNNYIVQSDYSTRPVDIYGYGGNDTIYLNVTSSYGGDNYVSAGTGDDKVVNYFEGGNDIYLGDGNDLYIADISAGDSNDYDIVRGGYGNDRFEVDSERSDYYGDAGNDTFLSVGVDNYFNGGSGTDTISYRLQDDYASQRGKGVTIDLGRQWASTTSGHKETLISIENAIGTNAGHDDITGSSGRNILQGLGGNDILDGLGGNDDLYGGAGNDDLYGGTGDDDLVGGSGDDDLVGDSGVDYLAGGSGFDFLSGGTGADIFDFNSAGESVVGSRRDIISDFHRSELDVVDLRSIDANENSLGNQNFKFIGGQSFHGTPGELRFSGGVVSGDTDGDGYSDFQIKMNGVTRMYADDFVL